MRSVEFSYGHAMGHHLAKTLAGKPGMQVKRRRLDLEGRLAQFAEIEIDGMIGRRADGGRDTGKSRERGAMHVARGNELDARMFRDDGRKRAGVEKILPIHVPDAGAEWRVMQEQQRRPLRRSC